MAFFFLHNYMGTIKPNLTFFFVLLILSSLKSFIKLITLLFIFTISLKNKKRDLKGATNLSRIPLLSHFCYTFSAKILCSARYRLTVPLTFAIFFFHQRHNRFYV